MTDLSRLSSRQDIASPPSSAIAGIGFSLTQEDRLVIERLLAQGDTGHAPNPALLAGLLRHKLRIARSAPRPAPADLVTAGRRVTYMVSGGGARSDVLDPGAAPAPGRIVVASLLGATLIGMRKLQKVPLLRDDGRTETLVVLNVETTADERDA